MAPLVSILYLTALIVADSTAFSSPLSTSLALQKTTLTTPSSHLKKPKSPLFRGIQIRGGQRTTSVAMKSTSQSVDPAAKNKKVRISAFDSMRFFLILCIVLGHFIRFANPGEFVFKFFSQHNVIVGAFFALSGYVSAYTSTENASRVPSPKLVQTPKQKWILSRVFGYYPLHLLALLLFSPMFVYTDVHYSGWPIAAWNGLLSVTMTQAWFPMNAEVWNAPTWFLSALTFATMILPFSLPAVATMTKSQLRKTAGWIFAAYLLPKLGYLYDLNTWSLVEGISAPKAYPNLAMFNAQRFSPVYQVAEVLLGAVACRLVMLDNDPDEKTPPRKTNMLSTAVPLLGMLGLMALRGAGVLNVSDLLFRSVLFVPMFLLFLMAAHRNTVTGSKDPIVGLLSHPILVSLGNLAFPIFILHGPIGQVFYKKLIATQLFGKVLEGPDFFAIYLATTLISSWILQQTFMKSTWVSNWSNKAVEQLSSWM